MKLALPALRLSLRCIWHVVGYKNFDEALAEIKALRPVVSPSKSIIVTAKAYLEAP